MKYFVGIEAVFGRFVPHLFAGFKRNFVIRDSHTTVYFYLEAARKNVC